MIAAWMFTAIVFTALLGLAAFAAERGLRTLRLPGRWPWLFAFAMSVTWPLAAPLVSRWLPAARLDPLPPGIPDDLPPVLQAVKVLAPAPIDWLPSLGTSLLVLWALVSTLLLVRLVLAWRGIARVERSATPRDIAGVAVLLTSSLGPAVFGVRSPRVFVPSWMEQLEAPLRELVVRHEDEHRRASDPQVVLAVSIVMALMPWNLAAWWVARRTRLAMELDCDARVLRTTPHVERYARLLLFIAQRQSAPAMTTMLAESTSDLSRRIAEMHAPRVARPWARVMLLSLAVCAAIACSTRYGSELATPPAPARATTSSSAGAVALYYAPEGSTPATPLRGAVPPRYPDSLRLAGVEGEVVTQYVVDSSGRVMPGSIKVLSATHPMFAAAVQSSLPGAAFQAPTFQGRKVKQLVQQSWYFDMRDGTARLQRPPVPIAQPSPDPSVRAPMLLRAVVTTAVR